MFVYLLPKQNKTHLLFIAIDDAIGNIDIVSETETGHGDGSETHQKDGEWWSGGDEIF